MSVLLGAPKQRVDVWAVDTLKAWSGLDYLLAWERSMASCCDAGFRDAYDVKDFCGECVDMEMDGKAPPTPQAWFAAKGGYGANASSSSAADAYPCGEALAAIRKVVSLVAGAVGVPPSVFLGATPGEARAAFDAHVAAKAREEVEAQAAAVAAAVERERGEAAALAAAVVEEKERVRRREMDRTALDAQAAKRVVLAAALAAPALQQQQSQGGMGVALYTISPNIAAATAAAAAAAAASSLSGGGEAGKKKGGVEGVGSFLAPPSTTSSSSSSSTTSTTTFVNQSTSSWVIKSTPPIMPFPYLSNSIILLAFLGLVAATWCMGGRLYDLPMGTA